MTKKSKLSGHVDALKAISDVDVDVGWFEDARYKTGQSVAAVMIANEFGTARAPARPLLRQSAAIIESKLPAFVARRSLEVLDGSLTADAMVSRVGGALVETVLSTLKAGNFEKNADSTIEAKGFNRPLVHTSELGQTLTFREHKGPAQ